MGCYKDSYSRAIPKLLGYYRSTELVKKCAEAVRSDGYTTFGAEYFAECWSGPRANESYDRYGPSFNCHNGVGGSWANDVYFLGKKCLAYFLLPSFFIICFINISGVVGAVSKISVF